MSHSQKLAGSLQYNPKFTSGAARFVATTALPDPPRLAKFAAAIYRGLPTIDQVQENDTKAEHPCRFREPVRLGELWALIPNCARQKEA